jgi:hypothetical protein
MSPGSSSEVKFEIGHVLFIDIIGYSSLLITQESEQVEVSGVTYGELKQSPDWDSLRGDPRFEQITTSLAPKDSSRK